MLLLLRKLIELQKNKYEPRISINICFYAKQIDLTKTLMENRWVQHSLFAKNASDEENLQYLNRIKFSLTLSVMG